MSHITPFTLHAYTNRALDVRISVETSETTGDFTALEFTAGTITKSGLTASDTAEGFNVDFTLTASDLNVPADLYAAELKATFGGEVHTLARGTLKVDE